MDFRDWGYDSRRPRERRSDDDVRLQSWDYTGEISDLERPSDGRRGGDSGYSSYSSSSSAYPSSSSSSAYSSGSVYRGRRRQQDDAVADDRPFGRRSARTRWQQGEEDSTGTFSRYEEPDGRGSRHTSGWTPEIAPTSGWTPSAAPTSGWVGAASTSEWTREAYTGEWTRGDFTGEWNRETGEPVTPSRSERPGERGGGRRRAAPDWRELPEQPSGHYDGRRAATPPQRDSFTDTSEWLPPRSDQAGEGQVSRHKRPDWAVGLDPSASGGRRRRSWQDQTEARWPSTRSESDRAEEPSGSWSSSAPVSGLSGTSSWSGRAEVARREEPTSWPPSTRDVRLSEDDPRWVGIPSSAPRSPAVAFPDERGVDYDDDPRRMGGSPTTYRPDAPRARAIEAGPGWRAPTVAPGSERESAGPAAPDWRPPTTAPGSERGLAGPTTTPDWRPPTTAPGSERGLAGPTTTPDWRPPTEAPGTRSAAAPDEWRPPAVAPGTERAVARASSRAAGWRPPAAEVGRERALGAAVTRVASPDELEDEYIRAPGGVLAAIVATLAWYAVPVLLFAIYTVFQGEESQALGSLSGGFTRLGAGLAISLVVAVLLRWVSKTWRSISVGLAAAVLGGGLSTVLLSAISGQPLGA